MADDLQKKIAQILQEAAPSDQPAPAAVNQVASGNHNLQVLGDLIISPRLTRPVVVQPGPQHITEAQAYKIHQLIKALVKYESQANPDASPRALFASWYRRLKRRYHSTSYKTIAADQGEAAIRWLTANLARLRQK